MVRSAKTSSIRSDANKEPVARDRSYHHGDLASALLDAGEEELSENGIEGFSLRRVAKRAGVSHAAPAHHFRNTNILLSAIAARGFQRFVARQEEFRRLAACEPQAQMEASGLGYVSFALENPALYRLMFGSDRLDFSSQPLSQAANDAFDDLVHHVANLTGNHASPLTDRAVAVAVAAIWASAHGLADLLISGRLEWLKTLKMVERNEVISAILRQSLP